MSRPDSYYAERDLMQAAGYAWVSSRHTRVHLLSILGIALTHLATLYRADPQKLFFLFNLTLWRAHSGTHFTPYNSDLLRRTELGGEEMERMRWDTVAEAIKVLENEGYTVRPPRSGAKERDPLGPPEWRKHAKVPTVKGK